MQSETICIRDLNLCYRAFGRGPDVLFIHGWASSGRIWLPAIETLAERFRCWAIDLAGFGDSDTPSNSWYALPNYTAAVCDFAQAVGVRQAHVVGHSMGGMIALDLAAACPALVQRLVVVNPVVTGRVRIPVAAFNGRRLGPSLSALARRVWPVAVRLAVEAPLAAWLAERTRWGSREDMAKVSSDTALSSLRAMVTYSTAPVLSKIAAPTLVMIGDRDMVISPDEGRLAARRIPGARLETFRAGHVLMRERPAEFHAALNAFLDSRN